MEDERAPRGSNRELLMCPNVSTGIVIEKMSREPLLFSLFPRCFFVVSTWLG